MESDQSSVEDTNVWNEHNISLFDHQYCTVDRTKQNKKSKTTKLNKIIYSKDNTKINEVQRKEVSIEIVRLDRNELAEENISELEVEEDDSIEAIERYIKSTSTDHKIENDKNLDEKDEICKQNYNNDIVRKHQMINKILDDQQKIKDCEHIDYSQDLENDLTNDTVSSYNDKIDMDLINNDKQSVLITNIKETDELNLEDFTQHDLNKQYNMKQIFKTLCAIPLSNHKKTLENHLSNGISSSNNGDIYEDFDLSFENRINEKGNIIRHTKSNKNDLETNTKNKFLFDNDASSTETNLEALKDSDETVIYEIVCSDLDADLKNVMTNMELDLRNDENESFNVQLNNSAIEKKGIRNKRISKGVKRNTRQHSKNVKPKPSLSVVKSINKVIDEPIELNNVEDTYNDNAKPRAKNRSESVNSLSFDDCIEGLINDVKKSDKKEKSKETINISIQNKARKKGMSKTANKEFDNNSSKSLSCNICLVNMVDHIELLNHLTEFHLEDVNMDTLIPEEYDIENDNNLIPINICNEFSIDNVINMEESENMLNDLEDVNANLPVTHTEDLIFPQATYFCSICESIFKEKANYDLHLNGVHIFNNKYNCHICKGSFVHKGRLRRHLREKHQNYKPKAFSDTSPVLENTNIDKTSSPTNNITDSIKSQILKASAIKMKRYHLNRNKFKRNINKPVIDIKPKIKTLKNSKSGKNKNKQHYIKSQINKKEFCRNNFGDIPQSEVSNYGCGKCKIKFNCKEKLLLHDKRNHRTMKLRQVCLKCGDTFETYIKLLRHIKNYHKINLFKLYKCDLCPVNFKSEDKLSQHYQLKHNIHLEVKDSLLQSEAEANVPVNFAEAMHACCICKSLFTSKEMLGRHVESEHILSKDFKQKCEQCGQITSTC